MGVLSGADKYDPARLDYDVRLLRQFYFPEGMLISIERVQGGFSGQSGLRDIRH